MYARGYPQCMLQIDYQQGLLRQIPYARYYKSRLVFFLPNFHFAAYIADNLCAKSGNSSFFKLKIRGL